MNLCLQHGRSMSHGWQAPALSLGAPSGTIRTSTATVGRRCPSFLRPNFQGCPFGGRNGMEAVLFGFTLPYPVVAGPGNRIG